MVSKLTVEEREQELLAKEETIQVCDTNVSKKNIILNKLYIQTERHLFIADT